MKKILGSLLALSILFVLSACGTSKVPTIVKEEVLTCNGVQEENGLKMDTTTILTFKGEKITKMHMQVDTSVEEKYAQYSDQIKESIEKEYENYKQNGATVEITVDGAKITAKIDMNLETMTDEQKKNLEVSNLGGSKEANKKEFESSGYTCK